MLTLRVEVAITVQDEAQARQIMSAVNSGYAEHVLKSSILYGAEVGVAQAPVEKTVKKKQSAEPLQLIQATSHGTVSTAPKGAEPQERSRGIVGRRGLTRKGGK